jgi:hypothetical protein
MTRRESFTEIFGFSGYSKPVDYIRLNDPRPDLKGYTEVEVSVNHDMIETFVIQANDEISKRIGTPTYIIETTKIMKHTGKEDDIYDCVFMVMKKNGFSYGFSVVASFTVKGDAVKLISLRSQPLESKQPSDIRAFTDGSPGKEFLDFNIVEKFAVPTKSEFEKAKNKLQ